MMPEDLDAFARRTRGSLVSFAFGITGSREQAEDVVQDVFARLAKVDLATIDDLDGYARRAVVNETRTWLRRVIKFRSHVRDQLENEAIRTHRTERVLSQAEVFGLLATLTQRQRTIVVAKYYFDLPDQEVAEIVGCSPATIRSTASQALRRARRALEADNQDQEGTTTR